MKYLYRISLIFMILTITSAALLGGYYWYQKYSRKHESVQQAEEIVKEVSVKKIATDCDTEYVILEQDLVKGGSNTFVREIPAKYINKTKTELISLLEEEEHAPALRDRKKGLVSIRLSVFSNERVVVIKTYKKEVKKTMAETAEVAVSENDTGCFFLMANNGYVSVYCNDMRTLYLSTDIALEHLPDELQQEILDKKYIKNEEELYNFLESYSS